MKTEGIIESERLCADGTVGIQEALRFIGISRSVLYEHMSGKRKPKLPYVKMGRRRMIPRIAIREFLNTVFAKGNP